MRTTLDRLYLASGALAALFLALIGAMVLAQVGLNVLDRLAQLVTGRASGWFIPSYSDFAGYFLAASSFFAIAHTLRRGAHIRVTLAIGRMGPGLRRVFEIIATAIGAALAAYATYWMGILVYESWSFGDVSPGIVAVPLWLPQLPLVLGLAVATIAFVDALVEAVRGARPWTDPIEDPHAHG